MVEEPVPAAPALTLMLPLLLRVKLELPPPGACQKSPQPANNGIANSNNPAHLPIFIAAPFSGCAVSVTHSQGIACVRLLSCIRRAHARPIIMVDANQRNFACREQQLTRPSAPGPGSPWTGLRPWGGDPSHLGTWVCTIPRQLPGAPGPGSPWTGLRPWGGDPSHLGTWVCTIPRNSGAPPSPRFSPPSTVRFITRKPPCSTPLKISASNGPKLSFPPYSLRKSARSAKPPRLPSSTPATKSPPSLTAATRACSPSSVPAPFTTPRPPANTPPCSKPPSTSFPPTCALSCASTSKSPAPPSDGRASSTTPISINPSRSTTACAWPAICSSTWPRWASPPEPNSST